MILIEPIKLSYDSHRTNQIKQKQLSNKNIPINNDTGDLKVWHIRNSGYLEILCPVTYPI